MKLFTVGPTQMFPYTLEVSSKQLPYFRTEEFSKVNLECVEKIKTLLNAGEGSKVILLTASGSAAMESVVLNAFDENDKLLIINGGTFGARFVQIAGIHNIPYDEIKLELGEALTEAHFENLDLDSYTALLVNLDETSTGQLYDIEMLSRICKEHNIKFVSDEISSFLADPFDMEKYGVDAVIISSQKALAISPGLAIIALSKRFYEENIKGKEIKNLYMDINEHIVNMERGQTPNTPAVGIILELQDRLRHIESYEAEVEKTAKLAKYFREKAVEAGFELPKYPLSNTVTPVIVPNHKAKEVFNYLKEKYDIYVNPTGGKTADDVIRVAHIGNLIESDYDELIEKMKEVL